MSDGARDRTTVVSRAAIEFAVESAYESRIGTVARLAAEAADEDAFVAVLPAASVFGPDFRDHLYGVRGLRPDAAGRPLLEQLTYTHDAELVVHFLRRSPAHEWLALSCVPRNDGTRSRRLLTTEDGTSGRLKSALLTYAFQGNREGIGALGRTLARGALPWFADEFTEAVAEGMFTPLWWGSLLYPGGLDDDTGRSDADVAAIRQVTAAAPVG